MKKNFHVRKLRQSMTDIESCAAAFKGRHAVDDEFLDYPATQVLVAEDGKDSVYMPVQNVFLMETIGYQEGISPHALACALKQFVSVLVWEGNNAGRGELYFVGNNEETNAFALQNGFEEVNYKVYRLRHGRDPK